MEIPLEQLHVEVPGHPTTVNHIYGRARNGQVFKVARANKWAFVAERFIKLEARKTFKTDDLSSLKGFPLRLEIDVCRPTWMGKTKATKHKMVRPDLDNFCKQIFDLLKPSLGLEDSAVKEFTIRKAEIDKDPHVIIRLDFI